MQNNIFEEFKKKKKEKEIAEEKQKQQTTEPVQEEDAEKENKITDMKKDNGLENYNILYSNKAFKLFKEEYLKDEKVKTLMLLFDKLRADGVEIFDNDFFIYQKMKDKNIKLVMLEPTYDDVMLNKKESIFLVKAIYPKEYQEYIKTYKSREADPIKFQEFVITKGVLFPVEKQDFNKTFTSGQVLSLYDTIINMSDLNKKYKIIEV